MADINEAAITEQDARRLRKRATGVAAVMRTPAYIIVTLVHKIQLPTPDPYNRSVSKRAWETSMQNWRRALREALKQIHVEEEVAS